MWWFESLDSIATVLLVLVLVGFLKMLLRLKRRPRGWVLRPRQGIAPEKIIIAFEILGLFAQVSSTLKQGYIDLASASSRTLW